VLRELTGVLLLLVGSTGIGCSDREEKKPGPREEKPAAREEKPAPDNRHAVIGRYRGTLSAESVSAGVSQSHKAEIQLRISALPERGRLKLHFDNLSPGCLPTVTAVDGERLRVDPAVCNDAEPSAGCKTRTIEFKSGDGAIKNSVFSLIYVAHERQACGSGERRTDVTFSISARRVD
jgi:hypothetical protein